MAWIYNNPSQEKLCHSDEWNIIHNWLGWALSKMYEHHLTFNSRVNISILFKLTFCYTEMIKFNQCHWKVYRISTGMLLATFVLIDNWSILISKFTQVKWIPAAIWTCFVELVKRSNVNDGFGYVNNSTIFSLYYSYWNSAYKNWQKIYIDCVEGMPASHCTI